MTEPTSTSGSPAGSEPKPPPLPPRPTNDGVVCGVIFATSAGKKVPATPKALPRLARIEDYKNKPLPDIPTVSAYKKPSEGAVNGAPLTGPSDKNDARPRSSISEEKQKEKKLSAAVAINRQTAVILQAKQLFEKRLGKTRVDNAFSNVQERVEFTEKFKEEYCRQPNGESQGSTYTVFYDPKSKTSNKLAQHYIGLISKGILNKDVFEAEPQKSTYMAECAAKIAGVASFAYRTFMAGLEKMCLPSFSPSSFRVPNFGVALGLFARQRTDSGEEPTDRTNDSIEQTLRFRRMPHEGYDEPDMDKILPLVRIAKNDCPQARQLRA